MASFFLDAGTLLVSVSYFSLLFEIYVLLTKRQMARGEAKTFLGEFGLKKMKEMDEKGYLCEKDFA